MREPGDHAEDGFFNVVVTANRQQIAGLWTPNNKKQQKISFALKRREFRYTPKVGNYPQKLHPEAEGERRREHPE